mmetsp:Transcript_12958/g.27398  ORF Transcript_12958/g.27398 Transcript_12958/m.27398 type:complete len:204 (+) Transcript_12958:111-722(+)
MQQAQYHALVVPGVLTAPTPWCNVPSCEPIWGLCPHVGGEAIGVQRIARSHKSQHRVHAAGDELPIFKGAKAHPHQLVPHALEGGDGAGEEVVGEHLDGVLVALADERGQLLAVGGKPHQVGQVLVVGRVLLLGHDAAHVLPHLVRQHPVVRRRAQVGAVLAVLQHVDPHHCIVRINVRAVLAQQHASRVAHNRARFVALLHS